MENKPEGHLQAPPLPKQLFESSGISQEMRQGHKNGSLQVFFMSHPGTRVQKFEGDSSGTVINATSNRVPINYQSAALNLNGRPPSSDTTVSTRNETSTLVVTTHMAASGNAQAIPNNSLHSAEQSSAVIDESHERVVLVCKSCGGNFEETKSKTDASLEEWLHSDMCSHCQKMVKNGTLLNVGEDPNGQITTAHQTMEEEVTSCCCC